MAVIGRTPQRVATVTDVTDLTPRMRRLTVSGNDLVGVDVRPAQEAELVLTDDTGRPVKRRYTIRTARAGMGEWDIDVLLHSHGPGALWGATAKPGSTVTMFGPRGHLDLFDVDWQLFVGDEASLPAFAALAEASADGVGTHAFIEVDTADDELPLHSAGPLAVTWLHRGADSPAGTTDQLAPALSAFAANPPAGTGHAYLLGESRAVVALRTELATVLPHERIFTKGYWSSVTPRR